MRGLIQRYFPRRITFPGKVNVQNNSAKNERKTPSHYHIQIECKRAHFSHVKSFYNYFCEKYLQLLV